MPLTSSAPYSASMSPERACKTQEGRFVEHASAAPTPAADTQQLQVVRKSRRLLEVVDQDSSLHLTIQKVKIPYTPLGESLWQVQDVQHKIFDPLTVKNQAFSRSTMFQDATGGLLMTMSSKWFCRSSSFTWQSSTYRWVLVRFSMPVRLNLVEASSGKKVAALQGNWDVPCLKGEGRRNHKDHITIFDEPHDSLWQRLVVASGIKEADRHRRNRCHGRWQLVSDSRR